MSQETQDPLVAQTVKSLPAVQETWVQSLCQEDPLEKEMATHSSILTWRIPHTEEPDGLPSMGWQRVRHNWVTSLSLSQETQTGARYQPRAVGWGGRWEGGSREGIYVYL